MFGGVYILYPPTDQHNNEKFVIRFMIIHSTYAVIIQAFILNTLVQNLKGVSIVY